MTPEYINSLIAKEIMGWKPVDEQEELYETDEIVEAGKVKKLANTSNRSYRTPTFLFHPYTDMNSAMQVVRVIDSIFDNDPSLSLRLSHHTQWEARWGGDLRTRVYIAKAETPSAAICMAALDVCKVDVSNLLIEGADDATG